VNGQFESKFRILQTVYQGNIGGEDMLQYILDKLAIKKGETTPDGLFTVRPAECLASCGTGPCLQINGYRYVQNPPRESNPPPLEEPRSPASRGGGWRPASHPSGTGPPSAPPRAWRACRPT